MTPEEIDLTAQAQLCAASMERIADLCVGNTLLWSKSALQQAWMAGYKAAQEAERRFQMTLDRRKDDL